MCDLWLGVAELERDGGGSKAVSRAMVVVVAAAGVGGSA